MGCQPQLPAQLMTTLLVTCNVGCAFVGLMADFSTFIEGVYTPMQDLDALFVVNWEARRKQWLSGLPVEMCVVPPTDQEADEASGEDEAPPVAQTPNKKRKTDAPATPVAPAPAPKKARAKNKKGTTAAQGTLASFHSRVRTASGLPKSGGKKG